MCPLTQLKLAEWRGEMVREQRMPTNILSRNENHGLPLKNTVRCCLVVGWRSSGLHVCRDTNCYLWQLLLLSDNADRQGWRYGQFHRNLRRHAHRHRAESHGAVLWKRRGDQLQRDVQCARHLSVRVPLSRELV